MDLVTLRRTDVGVLQIALVKYAGGAYRQMYGSVVQPPSGLSPLSFAIAYFYPFLSHFLSLTLSLTLFLSSYLPVG